MTALLLPLATANVRCPVRARVSTTDATPTRGGTTAFWWQAELVRSLYRMVEQRGCRTRLNGIVAPDERLLPAFAEVEHFVGFAQRHMTRARACRQAHHINLQEIHEVQRELETEAETSMAGVRLLNGIPCTLR